MFVDDDTNVFVNVHSNNYATEIKPFLECCAQPVSRTHHIHHFAINAASLSAAAARPTARQIFDAFFLSMLLQ